MSDQADRLRQLVRAQRQWREIVGQDQPVVISRQGFGDAHLIASMATGRLGNHGRGGISPVIVLVARRVFALSAMHVKRICRITWREIEQKKEKRREIRIFRLGLKVLLKRIGRVVR